MKQQDILVVGSCNTDMVIKTTHFPKPGETIIGGDFFLFPGGKGANQAVAAARLGGQVALVCKVGDDVFGQQALGNFRNENINTEGVFVEKGVSSGVALITVNAEGENQIVVSPGANACLSLDDLIAASAVFAAASCVVFQLEIPLESVTVGVKMAASLGKRVILNPAPAQPLPEELLPMISVITPNETEVFSLTGITVRDEASALDAAKALLGKGVENVVITMGAAGAFFCNREESWLLPPPPVQPVDTTAAGDVFNGALAVAISEGMAWKAAVSFANAAAAVAVTRMGAQTSAPYRHEI